LRKEVDESDTESKGKPGTLRFPGWAKQGLWLWFGQTMFVAMAQYDPWMF
jgi:hypothetical protein